MTGDARNQDCILGGPGFSGIGIGYRSGEFESPMHLRCGFDVEPLGSRRQIFRDKTGCGARKQGVLKIADDRVEYRRVDAQGAVEKRGLNARLDGLRSFGFYPRIDAGIREHQRLFVVAVADDDLQCAARLG